MGKIVLIVLLALAVLVTGIILVLAAMQPDGADIHRAAHSSTLPARQLSSTG